LFVQIDVSREAQVRRGVAAVARRFGRLDALINNAGVADPKTGFDAGKWDRIIGVNLTGAFLCAKHAAPHLKAANGRIVNIASTRARMSEPDTHAYSASKGGLVALTHSLAITLGPDVLVNCVSPGWIDTGKATLSPQDHRQHPAGRVGRPRDVAELVLWLCSPQSAFVTGQDFTIDGGMTRKMIYA
jgi:NAD(P)-dependent dehydrogenase (short-subunit alcohol dehydrogenase family)